MITKFIEPWVLIPGVLVLAGAAGALLLLRTARRLQRRVGATTAGRTIRRVGIALAIAAVLLFLASTEIVSGALLGSLEYSTPHATLAALSEAEWIVILGGGTVYGVPPQYAETTDTERRNLAALQPESMARALHGLRLARRLDLPVVFSGGNVFPDPTLPAEATVARALLIDLGLDPQRVTAERDSRTTAENAARTRELIGPRTIALVTSAWHMRRAVLAFERAGFDVMPAPGPFTSDWSRPFQPVMLMPSAASLEDTARWWRETVGFVWYRIRG